MDESAANGDETPTIDLARTPEPRDAIHRVVQALCEFQTVQLPLERPPRCVRLTTAPPPPAGADIAGSTEASGLLFDHVSVAADFLPELSDVQARLVLRSWPGPVHFEVPVEPQGPLHELPPWVRERLVREGYLTLRVDGLQSTAEVAALIPAPMAFGPPAVLGDVAFRLDDSLVTEDGPPPTVVRLLPDGRYEVRREGAVSASELRQRQGIQILMVCTGNTCRSPMAEVAFRRMLAEELGLSEDQLAESGVRIVSAGIAARYGSEASPHSVAAVRQDALDLTNHVSRPATIELLSGSDLVLTMTQGHRASIVSSVPELAQVVQVLAPDGRDVADPVGGSAAQYRACYDEISAHLRARLPAVARMIRDAGPTE